MLIYADTSIWNCLCDQDADAHFLVTALARQDNRLVLGENVVTELAKTYQMRKPEAGNRAQQLFSYLKRYFADISALKPTWAILIEEALDAWGDGPAVAPLVSKDHLANLRGAIDELAGGVLGPQAQGLVSERKRHAQRAREEMRSHLDARPKLSSILRQVTPEKLDAFLKRETMGFRGRNDLAGHLRVQFPQNTTSDLISCAKKLLASRRYRVSRSLVRSDVYLNWRCAIRGSLRSDIPDDIYHVVNASYCDFFVTTDRDQAEYVQHALEGVTALLYHDTEPILAWLIQKIGAAPS